MIGKGKKKRQLHTKEKASVIITSQVPPQIISTVYCSFNTSLTLSAKTIPA